MAGRYDLGMLCVAANDAKGFDALDANWKIACEIAEENGRTMDRSRLRVVTPMHLAPTREQAFEEVHYGMAGYIDYFNNNMPRFFIPEGVDPVEWVIENHVGVIGTPDDAIDRIESLLAKQGEFGCLLLHAHNWADWPATKRSYEMYARYVIPHFARANVARTESYQWVTDHQDELVEKRVNAAQQMFDKHEAEQKAKAELRAAEG
jgi:limonene 1,2-monooxygenase